MGTDRDALELERASLAARLARLEADAIEVRRITSEIRETLDRLARDEEEGADDA